VNTFIVTVTAQPGHDAAVTSYYESLKPVLAEADGFIARKIYRSRTGEMAAAVKKAYTEEELAKHAEPPHEDPGTTFVIVEQWNSVEDRIAFGKQTGQRNVELIPHLLPAHSHEFFDELPG
jgi:heme-degrading monooxygenase HmoA